MHLCSIEMLLLLFVLVWNGKNGALAFPGKRTQNVVILRVVHDIVDLQELTIEASLPT